MDWLGKQAEIIGGIVSVAAVASLDRAEELLSVMGPTDSTVRAAVAVLVRRMLSSLVAILPFFRRPVSFFAGDSGRVGGRRAGLLRPAVT